MKTVPQKGAEDSEELAPALTHSCWLNSLDYFGSRHSAAFLYLCSHSCPAKPTVAKFLKLKSSLFTVLSSTAASQPHPSNTFYLCYNSYTPTQLCSICFTASNFRRKLFIRSVPNWHKLTSFHS